MTPRDKPTRDVLTFHRAFDCPVREVPEIPSYDDMSCRLLMGYAHALSVMAVDLKKEAAEANGQGRNGLAQVLVRLQLHVEETAELAQGLASQNPVEILDALGDIDYVTAGTYLVVGMGALRRKAHEVIHTSNMSKLGEDGRPILHESGRVVKGPNYRDPKEALRRLIEEASPERTHHG